MPEIQGRLLQDEPMSRHTSFKIGGPADLFVTPADAEELRDLLVWAHRTSVPVFFLGAGSNLLVSDLGIRGMVVQLGPGFRKMRITGNLLVAGAAVRIPALVRKSLGVRLTGIEGLAGIPGTVGGAIYMNAGTPVCCVADTLESVRVIDPEGKFAEISAEELGFRYRESSVGEMGLVVLDATFVLKTAAPESILQILESLNLRRKVSQPGGIGTAGSVFKNPPGGYAGEILDKLGAKGMQVGGARVSSKHANFIENTGSATAKDVCQLMERLQLLARDEAGVALVPEIQFVGEWC
ncbi:MAG: UDP-N-acetylmuramate dehydrogenase [Armatimonadota bacterium]